MLYAERCCDVLSLGINYTLESFRGHQMRGRVQSACKCDLVCFTLVLSVNNNRQPKLDASHVFYPYVICLLVP